jgi:ribosomal protein S13
MTTSKLTTGLNDRPKGETIAQTGAGIPDDTGRAPELDEEEAAKIEQKIRSMGTKGGSQAHDELEAEVKQDIELPLKGSA